MRRNGSGLRQITNDPTQVDLGPNWSPRGTRIAFTRCAVISPDQCGPSNVYTINPDGTGLRQVTFDGFSTAAGYQPIPTS